MTSEHHWTCGSCTHLGSNPPQQPWKSCVRAGGRAGWVWSQGPFKASFVPVCQEMRLCSLEVFLQAEWGSYSPRLCPRGSWGAASPGLGGRATQRLPCLLLGFPQPSALLVNKGD